MPKLPTKTAEIQRHRLKQWELMTLEASENLDRVLSKLKERYDLFELLPNLIDAPIDNIGEARKFYTGLSLAEEQNVFVQPSQETAFKIGFTETRREGEVAELEFNCRFNPLFPDAEQELKSDTEKSIAYARVWRRPYGESKGTIIAIPGWYITDPRLSAIALLPGFFFSQGYNVVIYELPYTQHRVSDAGFKFPSSNIVRTNEGILQTIFELRTLRAWLEGQGEEIVGVLGSSFGGYLAALWASIDSFEKVLLVSPVSDLLKTVNTLITNNTPGSDSEYDFESIFGGLSQSELGEALDFHNPLKRNLASANTDCLIIGAKQDKVVQKQEIENLAKHWNNSKICWVDGGHFGQLCTKDAQDSIKEFLTL